MCLLSRDKNYGLQFQSQNLCADIALPLGTELLSIGNAELPQKDVGNALQFLEFCAAFGKVPEVLFFLHNTFLFAGLL